jgi:hypothetical protein
MQLRPNRSLTENRLEAAVTDVVRIGRRARAEVTGERDEEVAVRDDLLKLFLPAK